jgi:hypothetical protein
MGAFNRIWEPPIPGYPRNRGCWDWGSGSGVWGPQIQTPNPSILVGATVKRGTGVWGQAPNPGTPFHRSSNEDMGLLHSPYGAAAPGAGGPRGHQSIKGYPTGHHMSPRSANPYNARARNVRACPRARARGMNPRWSIGFLFWAPGPCLPRPFGEPEGCSFGSY